MRSPQLVVAVLGALMLAACSKPRVQAPESYIEVQVAVGEPSASKGGESLVRSFTLPIPGDGSAGQASAVADGARLDIGWTRTAGLPNKAPGLRLDGFRWSFGNRFIFPGGSSGATLSGGPENQLIGPEFVTLLAASPAGQEGGAPAGVEVVVRGRWLAQPPTWPDIPLETQKAEEPKRKPAAPDQSVVGPF